MDLQPNKPNAFSRRSDVVPFPGGQSCFVLSFVFMANKPHQPPILSNSRINDVANIRNLKHDMICNILSSRYSYNFPCRYIYIHNDQTNFVILAWATNTLLGWLYTGDDLRYHRYHSQLLEFKNYRCAQSFVVKKRYFHTCFGEYSSPLNQNQYQKLW